MSGRLAPYPSYKGSAVKWFGRIPAHWQTHRLKHVATVQPSNVDKKSEDGELPVKLCNYVDVYHHDRITAGMDFMRATATEAEKRKFQLQTGDVCVTKDSEEWSDIAVPAYVAEDVPDLLCGYHLALVRPRIGHTHGGFLARAFAAAGVNDQFRVEANGITRFALGQDALCDALFPVPPFDEQQAITEFLDRETGKIDALVKKKERLIELLQEKRTALISHAVTQGLNPDAPMKDSGIPWVGNIPRHWEVKRLKLIAEVRSGVAKGRDFGGRDTMEVPYLRVANVQDGYLDLADVATIVIATTELKRFSLRKGDVLMNEGGDYDKLGRGSVWQGQVEPCVHQNHVFAVRPHHIQDSDWINTITLTCYAKFYFMFRSKQSTNLASISGTNIQELPVVMPPRSERQAVLGFLAQQTAQLDGLVAKIRTVVERLQEYRAAIISAAVTGQIDVRKETN